MSWGIILKLSWINSDPYQNLLMYPKTFFNRQLLTPLLPRGRNVFTTDGHFWKHCRTQVNLIFTRAHVSDLSGFQVYFDKFMEKLPEDGRVFDINPLVDTLVGI